MVNACQEEMSKHEVCSPGTCQEVCSSAIWQRALCLSPSAGMSAGAAISLACPGLPCAAALLQCPCRMSEGQSQQGFVSRLQALPTCSAAASSWRRQSWGMKYR